MKKINIVWLGPTLILLALVIVVQFIVIASKDAFNYENFEIKGLLSPCSKGCFPFSVRTVYRDSPQMEIHSSETNYSGIIVAQICEDIIETVKCSDLDIAKLPDYKMVSRRDTAETFPGYTYINKYVGSSANKKIYFLYVFSQATLDLPRWAYDYPLAVVSFNMETREVKKEGQLSITGLHVEDMRVSPDGSYLLVVDSSNPQYTPMTMRSNIILFDLKNKITKTFATVGNGGTFEFIDWIDDSHFFYKEYKYGDGRNATFRIGTLD